MNLFYVPGINKVIDSDLVISDSPIDLPGNIGISVDNEIWTIQHGEGGLIHHGRVYPLTYLDSSTGPLTELSSICTFGSDVLAVGGEEYQFYTFLEGGISGGGTLGTGITWFDAVITPNGYYVVGTVLGSNELNVGFYDGVDWVLSTIATVLPTDAPRITYGNGKFIICEKNIYTSTNGNDWSLSYTTSSTIVDCLFNGDIFIALGSSIFRSVDGLIWESNTLPVIDGEYLGPGTWQYIEVNNNVMIMQSSINTVDVSYDVFTSFTCSVDNGVSWNTQTVIQDVYSKVFVLGIPKFWEHFIKTTES